MCESKERRLQDNGNALESGERLELPLQIAAKHHLLAEPGAERDQDPRRLLEMTRRQKSARGLSLRKGESDALQHRKATEANQEITAELGKAPPADERSQEREPEKTDIEEQAPLHRDEREIAREDLLPLWRRRLAAAVQKSAGRGYREEEPNQQDGVPKWREQWPIEEAIASLTRPPQGDAMLPATLAATPVLAVGYSLLYLLFGGGIGGAILIFIIAKMLRK